MAVSRGHREGPATFREMAVNLGYEYIYAYCVVQRLPGQMAYVHFVYIVKHLLGQMVYFHLFHIVQRLSGQMDYIN